MILIFQDLGITLWPKYLFRLFNLHLLEGIQHFYWYYYYYYYERHLTDSSNGVSTVCSLGVVWQTPFSFSVSFFEIPKYGPIGYFSSSISLRVSEKASQFYILTVAEILQDVIVKLSIFICNNHHIGQNFILASGFAFIHIIINCNLQLSESSLYPFLIDSGQRMSILNDKNDRPCRWLTVGLPFFFLSVTFPHYAFCVLFHY